MCGPSGRTSRTLLVAASGKPWKPHLFLQSRVLRGLAVHQQHALRSFNPTGALADTADTEKRSDACRQSSQAVPRDSAGEEANGSAP